MAFNLKNRNFLKLLDFSAQEINFLLELSETLKKAKYAGTEQQMLKGKNIALIFEKASTRTRCAFEVAAFDQGAHVTYLGPSGSQIGHKETMKDTARVLGRMYDGIEYRGFGQEIVEELAQYAGVPVINGLTDLLHPCQILADLMTVREQKGKLAGLKLAYVGDGNNVCHSLLFGCAKTGVNISVASPEGYLPRDEIVEAARSDAGSTGAVIAVTTDPGEAVAGADVVVTDVWASMGQESEQQARMKTFAPYQVNTKLVSGAASDYIFLHCLPAHRGEEVTAEIIDGPHAVVFEEAENRLHAQKAVLALLMDK